ncbi:MAG: hypothetical protein AB7O62_15685 [Pirellulales bacterium]
MSLIHHPALHDSSYPPAHGPVLLLSCMDPRLLDDTVEFMNHDNLCNRYDHVILAGAALGALGGCNKKYSHWKKTFFDHLAGACELHAIEEVYILEHRGCGAYHKIFKVAPPFGDSQEDQAEEAACHLEYAKKLEVEIVKWGRQHHRKLKVKSFLMDLRGRVSFLV